MGSQKKSNIKEKIKGVLFNIMWYSQYLFLVAATFLLKFRDVKWYIPGACYLIMVFIQICGLEAARDKESDKKLSERFQVSSAIVTASSAFFSSVKLRFIIMIIAFLPMFAIGEESKNRSKNNNILSYSSLMITGYGTQLLINIIYCFVTWKTGLRKWNLIYTILYAVIFAAGYRDPQELKNYDEYEDQLIAEKKERKEREKKRYERFLKSDYRKATGVSWTEVNDDTGVYGEYCTSTFLSDIKYPHWVLYSVYIPTDNNLGSTEVDIMVFTQAGIHVVEVKNRNVKWKINNKNTVIIKPNGREENVRSPFSQNLGHMTALEKFMKNLGNTRLKDAFELLNENIIGYVVLGPATIKEGTENNEKWSGEYKQHLCYWNKIGEEINYDINLHHSRYFHEDRAKAAETLYNELKYLQGNYEYKSKHDRILIKENKRK